MTTNSPLLNRVINHVDEKAIVVLASDLIRIPSFKPDETPVAIFLAEFFRSRDYRVELQEVEPGASKQSRHCPEQAAARA